MDAKTSSLAYLAVLSALGLISGIPFHVNAAKDSGASLEEVVSAVLVGLPAAGHRVTQALPSAVDAYQSAGEKTMDHVVFLDAKAKELG
jgi:alkylhydroperoxidase/carboxymuconolactone decarboxylase family protein YurZ